MINLMIYLLNVKKKKIQYTTSQFRLLNNIIINKNKILQKVIEKITIILKWQIW